MLQTHTERLPTTTENPSLTVVTRSQIATTTTPVVTNSAGSPTPDNPMTDSSPRSDESPSTEAVLRALEDDACRTLLAELSEPMTANELSHACDIPQSTLYRKLDMLSQAALVRELIDVSDDGGRITRYERDVTDVTISVTDDGEFPISIDRPARNPDERLAQMWSDMRNEL